MAFRLEPLMFPWSGRSNSEFILPLPGPDIAIPGEPAWVFASYTLPLI